MNAKKAKQLRRLARKLAPITTPRYEATTYHQKFYMRTEIQEDGTAEEVKVFYDAVNPIELKVGTYRAAYKGLKKLREGLGV